MFKHNATNTSLGLFFKLFEEKYQQLQQNPGTTEWQVAADDYLLVLRSSKHLDLDETTLTQLVDYFKQLMLAERWSEYIPLDMAMDVYKQLLNLLQEKKAALVLRKSIVVCLYDYANYLAHFDGRLEEQRVLYHRLHEDYIQQNLQDMRFEYGSISQLAQTYSAQTQYRLSAFYFAYALKLVRELDDTAIHATETALIQQEAYLLYHSLCVQDARWLQFRCHIAIRSNNLNAYFEVYDELCRLGNYFWSIGDFKIAEACYEQLLTLLHTFPGQHCNPSTGTDYQEVHLEARAKIRARISIDDSAAELKLTQLQQRRKTLANVRDRVITNLATQPIQIVQAKCSQDLKSFIAGLCKETETQLGVAPCQFWAILCLGSLSRDEACLYSDVEFAIVWSKKSSYVEEKDVELYFRRLVGLLEMKIISLGETNKLAVPGKGTLVLKDMTAGLKFDEGKNYPFSGDKLYCGNLEWYLEFLIPKNANFQSKTLQECALEIDVNVKDALDIYMLTDAECLYGDKTLVTDFKEKTQILFAEQIQSQFRYREILAYRLVPNTGFNLDSTDIINIKEQLLHLPQRIVASLALFYGLKELSTETRITALVSKKIIHPHIGYLLRLGLRFGFSLRNYAHIFYHCENDDFYFGKHQGNFSETQASFAETIHLLLNDVYPVIFGLFQFWKTMVNQTATTMPLHDTTQTQKATSQLEKLLHHFVLNAGIRSVTTKISAVKTSQITNMGLYFMRDVLQDYEERKTILSAVIIEKSVSITRQYIIASILQLKEKLIVPLLHLAEDETLEQGFLKRLRANAQEAEKIIADWVELLLMLKLEEQHFMAWYAFLLQQSDEPHLQWCELFYHACLRYPGLEDTCLDMLELADSNGFRLLERFHERELQHAISNLAAKDVSKPGALKVILFRANRSPIQLHSEVIKQLLDDKDHIRHNTGERAKDAYSYRRIHRLQYQGTDIFFKEHSDFPIMAYGSYLLNMRLTGHGAALTELGWLKIEETIKKEVNTTVPTSPAGYDPIQFNNLYDQITAESHAILKKELLQFEPKQITDIEEKHVLKVVMLGPIGGGKSTVIFRMNNGYYPFQSLHYTIGVEWTIEMVRDSNTEYALQLWDVSGQERFRAVTNHYYKNADMIVVAFDPSRRETFEGNLKYLMAEVEYLDPIPIILLKTKSDLKGKISDEEIQAFMLENDIDAYCACSARTGEGIDEFRQILLRLAKQILLTRKHPEKAIKHSRSHEKAPASEPEIKRLHYPVLISLAVRGKTLAEVLNANEYQFHPLSTKYLSDCFLTEQIKHHGDALAQNFVMTPLKNRGHQLVCVDLEQMFVSPATMVGAVLKTRKIQEVNILTCLPELQPGGLLFEKGLHPEVVAKFANLDISKILNGWLESLERREQAYLQLINDGLALELNQQRSAKHPYFHRMIFPRGVLRKLAHDLWGIKVLATRALVEKRPLFPQEIVAHCSGKKIAASYFAPTLSLLSPQQRLQRITGRTVSQSNSEYQKFYVGENKTLKELFSSDYSIQHAKLELKGLYFNDINTEGAALKVFQSPRSMTINLAGMSAKEQTQAFALLFNSQRKNNKYQQLHIESCDTLDDATLRNIISSSERTLQSLTLKSIPKLMLTTMVYLSKRFTALTELVSHTLSITNISNGQSFLVFKSLRVLCINQCAELTTFIIKAPKLEHAEIKSNTQLLTLIIEAPNLAFIAIEENAQLKKIFIKPKLPSKLSLFNLSKDCEFIPNKNLYFKSALAYVEECNQRQAHEIVEKIGRTLMRIIDLNNLDKDVLDKSHELRDTKLTHESIYYKFVLGNDEPLPLPDYIKQPPYYPVPSQEQLITQFSSTITALPAQTKKGRSTVVPEHRQTLNTSS